MRTCGVFCLLFLLSSAVLAQTTSLPAPIATTPLFESFFAAPLTPDYNKGPVFLIVEPAYVRKTGKGWAPDTASDYDVPARRLTIHAGGPGFTGERRGKLFEFSAWPGLMLSVHTAKGPTAFVQYMVNVVKPRRLPLDSHNRLFLELQRSPGEATAEANDYEAVVCVLPIGYAKRRLARRDLDSEAFAQAGIAAAELKAIDVELKTIYWRRKSTGEVLQVVDMATYKPRINYP